MSDLTYKVLNTDGTITVYDKAAEIDSRLTDILTYQTITDAANIFAIDMANKAAMNCKMAITDNTAKAITVANPTIGCELFIELTYTDGGAITYTMSTDSTLTWLAGVAPTLTDGKTYRFSFFFVSATVIHANCVGGW